MTILLGVEHSFRLDVYDPVIQLWTWGMPDIFYPKLYLPNWHNNLLFIATSSGEVLSLWMVRGLENS